MPSNHRPATYTHHGHPPYLVVVGLAVEDDFFVEVVLQEVVVFKVVDLLVVVGLGVLVVL